MTPVMMKPIWENDQQSQAKRRYSPLCRDKKLIPVSSVQMLDNHIFHFQQQITSQLPTRLAKLRSQSRQMGEEG